MKGNDDRIARPLHYQVAAAIGLGLVCLAQYWQMLELPNYVVAAFGAWMVLFPRPRLPAAFVLLVSVLQIVVHWDAVGSFQFMSANLLFEPVDLLLAAGLLLFVVAQYRLVAIHAYIVPAEPFDRTRPKNRWRVPPTRPAGAMGSDEIVRLTISVPLAVLAGQVFWTTLYQNWTIVGIFPRFMQLAAILWIVFVGLFVGRGIVGYWRRAHSDPDSARMSLQEVDWREARADYGRIGRWLTWGIARAKKRWPSASPRPGGERGGGNRRA